MGTAAQDHNVAHHAKPIEADKMLCRLWESPSQLKQALEKDVRMSGGFGMLRCGAPDWCRNRELSWEGPGIRIPLCLRDKVCLHIKTG